MQDHGEVAWTWVKNTFCYLRNHPYPCLILRAAARYDLRAFTDSDHSKCPDTRYSISGYTIFLGDSLISFGAEYQRQINNSTAESEIIAHDLGSRKLRAVCHIVEAVGGHKQWNIPIYIDNTRARELVTSPLQPGANGHLDAKYFSIREHNESGLFQSTPVSTEENVADIMVTWKNGKNFHQLAKWLKGYLPLFQKE